GASAGTGTGNTGGRGGPGGFGHDEAVSDTSVVAKTIMISEADLKTALAGGQTVAQAAKAHNVPLHTVIDALVADGNSELQAQVANGSITQAQADAQKAAVVQRATDQANGTFGGGHPEASARHIHAVIPHADRSNHPTGRSNPVQMEPVAA